MEDLIIVCDFDGTISEFDSLYYFFKDNANSNWLEIERMWREGKIGSKECLKRQFELVEGLNEELIENYLKNMKLDPYFKEFNSLRIKKGINLVIVSDGADYFINKILAQHNIIDIKVISNHLEFIGNKFNLLFPNQNDNCINKSGTCKCSVVKKLREQYKKIVYIGDGHSDFCVCDKADILYAKGSLLEHCKKNNIEHIEYKNFKDIIEHFCF